MYKQKEASAPSQRMEIASAGQAASQFPHEMQTSSFTSTADSLLKESAAKGQEEIQVPQETQFSLSIFAVIPSPFRMPSNYKRQRFKM